MLVAPNVMSCEITLQILDHSGSRNCLAATNLENLL